MKITLLVGLLLCSGASRGFLLQYMYEDYRLSIAGFFGIIAVMILFIGAVIK